MRVTEVWVGEQRLPGLLTVPPTPDGLIVFAHGSGSSRFSPRNTAVARRLNEAGFGTLLFDLLTEAEAADRANVFDIPLLGARMCDAVGWCEVNAETRGLPVGLFGASTGAAAALVAAARLPDKVDAVVSRGGRPDLAVNELGDVAAPTLLIVGGDDVGVIGLNETASARLRCLKRLEVIDGATHLFEEAGMLDKVIDLAVAWFRRHLAPSTNRREKKFADRAAAGRALAARLEGRRLEDPVVLALPRGGVPVAVEIARTLSAPLDLVFVRKIGAPYQPELAAAAVVDGGDPEIVVNPEVMAATGMDQAAIDRQAKRELAEIERRRGVYLAGRKKVQLDGRTLILVDDGIATGASVRAALAALRRRRPRKLILAVPVAPSQTVEALASDVDELICLRMPEPFYAIGLYYRDFHQVEDDEVVRMLKTADAAAGEARRRSADDDGSSRSS